MSGYARMDGDLYCTPTWVTDALLDRVRFVGTITDVSCGQNHIVDACRARGLSAQGTDIVTGHDFLADDNEYVCVVTNPPYGTQGALAVRFIEHALQATIGFHGQVAMLLPVDFDSAKTRSHLFRDCPWFQQKIVLLKRIRWANLPQSDAGPSKNHAWFVWNHGNTASPVLRYA